MEFTIDKNLIKIYHNGIEIIEDTSYDNVILIINELIKDTQDLYQLEILNEILRKLELEVA